MKSKMRKDLSIEMIPENKFEKCIIELGNMVKRDEVKVFLEKMSMAELLHLKNTLQFVVKLLRDKIGYVPTYDLNLLGE